MEDVEGRLSDQTASQADPELTAALSKTKEAFEAAMDDDFNVQNALTAIYELLPVVNSNVNSAASDKEALKTFVKNLKAWLLVFGVDAGRLVKSESSEDDSEIEALVAERTKARQEKNWARSDEIRDQLQAMGIVLKDTPQGTRWSRE